MQLNVFLNNIETEKSNLRKFNHLFYVKKQKYFKEKIFMETSVKNVLKELQSLNAEITRLIFYDNCTFVQYNVRWS